MKKFLCAVLFMLVLAGLSYAAEDAGTVSWQDFTDQANNSLKFKRLYEDKYVTVTGCKVLRIEEAKGNGYVLIAQGDRSFEFIFTAANAKQLVDLDVGDVVTIRGFALLKRGRDIILDDCKIIK
ncbi:MAG: hypothetical protein IJ667_05405 [Synergistaceae bacterium]|nr:hypothetical protein [Synergistaceae bacterium]